MTGDEADRAQIAIDQHLEFAIKKSSGVTVKHNGFCLYCKEKSDKRFCDVDCRDDYEKRKRAESQRLY